VATIELWKILSFSTAASQAAVNGFYTLLYYTIVVLGIMYIYKCVSVCVCVCDRHTRRRRFFSHFYFTRTRGCMPLINIIILFMNANKRPPAREMQRLRSAETAEMQQACASLHLLQSQYHIIIILQAHRTRKRVRLCARNKQTVPTVCRTMNGGGGDRRPFDRRLNKRYFGFASASTIIIIITRAVSHRFERTTWTRKSKTEERKKRVAKIILCIILISCSIRLMGAVWAARESASDILYVILLYYTADAFLRRQRWMIDDDRPAAPRRTPCRTPPQSFAALLRYFAACSMFTRYFII